MKIKSIYLFLLAYINITSFCHAKDKEEEKPFKCPCTCSCIELATDGVKPTAAFSSLPFDEPFMLYWKKDKADVLNGKFKLFSKNNDLLENGNVSTYGDHLIAKVTMKYSRFSRQPNK